MAKIRIKEGVTPRLVHIMAGVANAAMDLVDPAEIWITAGSNGKHKKLSLHYQFKAVDVRSKNFPSLDAKKAFLEALKKELGSDYDVLYESDGTINEHFHVEYDPE